MSYSPPSGLMFGSTQISRVFTRLVSAGSSAVALGEEADDLQRHFHRQMLAGVVQGNEKHRGLGRVIHIRLVADLDGQDRPSLQA